MFEPVGRFIASHGFFVFTHLHADCKSHYDQDVLCLQREFMGGLIMPPSWNIEGQKASERRGLSPPPGQARRLANHPTIPKSPQKALERIQSCLQARSILTAISLVDFVGQVFQVRLEKLEEQGLFVVIKA
jgi:hypothetical protein